MFIMKNILFSICILFSLSVSGQVMLNQIQPYKPGGVRTPGYFGLTNANGVQVYTNLDSIVNGGMIDCDYIIGCLDSSDFFCDEVLECLDAGALCEAMNNFGNQNVASTGKFVWINQDGECKRGDISSLPGFGFNCDSVQNCLESGILCEVLNDFDTANITVGAKIIFIDDEGNCYRGDLGDIPGTFNCDSVLICLNDGLLCEAIGMFPMGVPADGDYVPIWNSSGECKLVSIDSLGGGMDSLNCEAVLACVTDTICGLVEDCLNDGALCDALKAFPEEVATTGFNVFGELGGECFKFNWDSATAECTMEIEVGSFGGNPEGCSWAATCDGGLTHNNPFWGSLALSGSTLQLRGNAEGQADCLMSDVSLSQFVAVDSIWQTGTCNSSSIVYSKGGSNFGFTLTPYSISAARVGPTVTISLLHGGVSCSTASFNICDGLDCNPLIGGEAIAIPSGTSINNVYSSGIREYKSRKAAINDCELLKGDIYIVKGSDKLRFKR